MTLNNTIRGIVHHKPWFQVLNSYQGSRLTQVLSQSWSYIERKIKELWGSTRCIAALTEAALCITHADADARNISRYRTDGIKSIICGIVHHASRSV